jgi:hypothetical protein
MFLKLQSATCWNSNSNTQALDGKAEYKRVYTRQLCKGDTLLAFVLEIQYFFCKLW